MFGMGGFNPAMLQNIIGAGRFGGLGGMQGGGYSGMGGQAAPPPDMFGGRGMQNPQLEQMASRIGGLVGGGGGNPGMMGGMLAQPGGGGMQNPMGQQAAPPDNPQRNANQMHPGNRRARMY